MALIGNYSVWNKTPGRSLAANATAHTAGAGTNSSTKPSIMKFSDWRKFNWNDQSGGTFVTLTKTAARPRGYYPQGAFALPSVAGEMAAFLTGDGAETGTMGSAINIDTGSNIVGSGDLSATAQLIVQLVASLTGAGDITTANLQALLAMVANLTGDGSLSGNTDGSLGNMTTALSGTATITAVTNALGNMSADIVSSSALSPESLAQALLDDSPIETGYSLRETLRLILSSAVAELSGAGGSTITIRDINNTVDRIIMAVDGTGNRTGGTYDVS